MSDCVFCDIVDGTAEASVAYQDGQVVAVMDISAINPGHVLVLPREHAVGLEDLNEANSAHVWIVGHRLARALRRSGLPCEGINMFLADGKAAFQEVFHVHLHVIPRLNGDSFQIDADWTQRDRLLLHHDAEAVCAGMRSLDVFALGDPTRLRAWPD